MSRRRALWYFVFSTALGLSAVGLRNPVQASEQLGFIRCPAEIVANGGELLNTIDVSQIGGGPTIPFVVQWYEYKRGNVGAGSAWYWPHPTTTRYRDLTYEWIGAGVKVVCLRVWVGVFLEIYDNVGHEGTAVLSSLGGVGGGGGGSGAGGSGGGNGSGFDDQTCFDIYEEDVDTGQMLYAKTICDEEWT